MTTSTVPTVEELIAAIHREHYRRLLAPLIRLTGSFEAAEDVVQEGFAAALSSFREAGVPDEPLAWLTRVTRNRALDVLRRDKRKREKKEQLELEAELAREELPSRIAVQDDSLRLIFTCCHPSLSPEAQIGLTLRTVCGLTSEQIARAFLVKRETLQQRLVRARHKIDTAKIPYVIPESHELAERIDAVLRTIYLVFNEGYGASDGESLVRRELCDEAIRLGRLVVELVPDPASPRALLALMLLHHARREARTDSNGDLVSLEEQDRKLWDQELIQEALPLVEEGLRARPLSTYAVESAIAALHARAKSSSETDWAQIAALYNVLVPLSANNPVVLLNRAVATALAGDLIHGLYLLEALEKEQVLTEYHLLPAARGHLFLQAQRPQEALAAFEQALALNPNSVERRFLERQIAELKKK